jgi:hypothetical protein
MNSLPCTVQPLSTWVIVYIAMIHTIDAINWLKLDNPINATSAQPNKQVNANAGEYGRANQSDHHVL